MVVGKEGSGERDQATTFVRLGAAEREKALRFYRGRHVLVLGADGFLGLHCVRALRELAASVTIVTRREEPKVGPFDGRVVRGDLNDEDVIDGAVADQSVVFDFAGLSGAVASNRRPVDHLAGECQPQLRLIEHCANQVAPPMIVFCSSRLVYGPPRRLPVNEEHPLAPQSVYAAHKILTENYLRVFHRLRGLPYCIFRLSNPYGMHQPDKAQSYGIINEFIRRAYRGEDIRLYGEGEQIRDYIYVADVMAAFLLVPLSAPTHNETFNLGSGAAISMREAATVIASQTGGVEIRSEPWPPDAQSVETGDYTSDLTKLRRRLNLLEPLGFEQGVSRTLDHYRALETYDVVPTRGR